MVAVSVMLQPFVAQPWPQSGLVIIHEKLEICRNSIINIALIRRLVTELEELIMINQSDNFLNLGKYLAERPGHESFGSSEPSTT